MDEVSPHVLAHQLRRGEQLSLRKILTLKFSLKCYWEIKNDYAGRAHSRSVWWSTNSGHLDRWFRRHRPLVNGRRQIPQF
jgi:hypothetical protein